MRHHAHRVNSRKTPFTRRAAVLRKRLFHPFIITFHVFCLAAAVFCLPDCSVAGERGLEKVLVGELPILPVIGNFIAKEKGFYEALGLDVEFKIYKSSTKVLPKMYYKAIWQICIGNTSKRIGINSITEPKLNQK